MSVERKYERDIDLLLAEEFSVSPGFASWFQAQTRFADLKANVVDVFVSRSDATGESEEAGAAIEDKIDAPLQPEQEQRYRLHTQREIDRGDYQACEVLPCAPAA